MDAFEELKKAVGGIFTTIRLKDAENEKLKKSKKKLLEHIEFLRNELHKQATTALKREDEE
jgi:hypothetical protein